MSVHWIQSLQDTSDEHYQNRHAVMETNEVQQRQAVPLKKTAGEARRVGKGKTLKLGKGKSALKMSSKGRSGNLALPSGSVSIFERPSDIVPKRLRSKIDRRRKDASLAEQVGPSEVVVVNPEVKSDVPVEGANVGPSGVESGDAAATTAEECSTPVKMDED